jgi:hypothetical protein
MRRHRPSRLPAPTCSAATLADLDGLRRGASSADGVIHLGFIHDFSNYDKSAETDRAAIHAMATALAGSNRPLVVTSGTLGAGAPGAIGIEDDPGDASRRFSENALDGAPRGVRGVVVRLSPLCMVMAITALCRG